MSESQNSQRKKSQNTSKAQYQSKLQDKILSLAHRLSVLQGNINLKIDRAECLSILEAKLNKNQFIKINDEVKNQFTKQCVKLSQKMLHHEEVQIEKIKQKLNISIQNGSKQKDTTELFVNQIAKIKETIKKLQKASDHRQKIVINLNNQICQKIDNLERQLYFGERKQKKSHINKSGQTESNYQVDLSFELSQKRQNSTNYDGQTFQVSTEDHRLNHIMRLIQALQKQLGTKLNIKDILPIVKQNVSPFLQQIQQVKKYVEGSLENIHKVVKNQQKINESLCQISNIGVWYSFEQKDGYAGINKQVINLAQDFMSCLKDDNKILINQQGNYIVKLLTPANQQIDEIQINGQCQDIHQQKLLKLEKNSIIKIPYVGCQIMVILQKL